MYGDVKEMRECVYVRRGGGFESFERPVREIGRGDSSGEGIKRVEVKGADDLGGSPARPQSKALLT